MVHKEDIKFELINLPEPPPLFAPPPQLQMEQVVELPDEEDPESDEALIEEIEELLNEESGEAELALAEDNGSFLLSDSQLGSVSRSELEFRKLHEGDASLSVSKKANGEYADDGGLDIGKSEKMSANRFVSDDQSLNLDFKTNNTPTSQKSSGSDEPRLGLSGGNERILRFASATMGMEDYKLWNKITAELDRLNKGRYGEVPDAIKRNRGGFIINFQFPDDTQQEIHWRKDGNIWIKVIGASEKTNIQELRRALNGLLGLSL